MSHARHRDPDATPLRDALARPAAATTGSLAVVAVAAVTAAAPASAQAPASTGSGYTVVRGDTVSEIAQRHGVKTGEVLAANGLRASSLIFPGQKLSIPGISVAPNVGPVAPAQDPSPAPSTSGKAAAVIAAAKAQTGIRYAWGEESPGRGFDCSGLTFYVYGLSGIKLPRTTTALRSFGTRVSAAEAKPGDLVLFNDHNHVAIYLGNGRIIDAPRKGTTVKERALWTRDVVIRRVL